MVLSRFWYVVLALLLGAALFLLNIASSMYNRAAFARARGVVLGRSGGVVVPADDARQRSGAADSVRALSPNIAKYLQNVERLSPRCRPTRGRNCRCVEGVSANIQKESGFDSVVRGRPHGRVVGISGTSRRAAGRTSSSAGIPRRGRPSGYVRETRWCSIGLPRGGSAVEFDLAAAPAGASWALA